MAASTTAAPGLGRGGSRRLDLKLRYRTIAEPTINLIDFKNDTKETSVDAVVREEGKSRYREGGESSGVWYNHTDSAGRRKATATMAKRIKSNWMKIFFILLETAWTESGCVRFVMDTALVVVAPVGVLRHLIIDATLRESNAAEATIRQSKWLLWYGTSCTYVTSLAVAPRFWRENPRWGVLVRLRLGQEKWDMYVCCMYIHANAILTCCPRCSKQVICTESFLPLISSLD